MRSVARAFLLALLLSGATVPAAACPVCETETGQQVRREIFDSRFGRNVLLTLLPFPILLTIVLAIYVGFPGATPATSMARRASREQQGETA